MRSLFSSAHTLEPTRILGIIIRFAIRHISHVLLRVTLAKSSNVGQVKEGLDR